MKITIHQGRIASESTQRNLPLRASACPRSRSFAICHSAFTLVELLVVIGIIAVLAAMAYPVYQRTVAGGKATACVSNLRQLGVGLNAYLQDHEMIMPVLLIARESSSEDVPVIDNTLDKYVLDRAVFACPADHKNFAARTGTSFCWNIALNGQPLATLNFLQLVTDRTHIPILSDKEGFHPYLDDKVNILYADGHATKDVKFFTGP
jgi:prepilin-type N-terminal cleavage/methylation domain-containing protein/prepilin-type processing-associated H-X9-DG protein